MAKKKPTEHFEDIIGAFNLPVPEREYSFHPERQWRFDYAWIPGSGGYGPQAKVWIGGERVGITCGATSYPRIAVEIDGGGFYRSAHNKPDKRANDNEKRNEAALMGWTVLVFNGHQLSSEEKRYAIGERLEQILKGTPDVQTGADSEEKWP